MKTFYWDYLLKVEGEYRNVVLALVEYVENPVLKNVIRMWGTLYKEADLYRVAVLSKDRQALKTIEELLPLEEAKSAVEKRLFDTGVIQEGDMIEDRTEGAKDVSQ